MQPFIFRFKFVVIWLNAFTGFNDGAVEIHSLGDSIYRNICFVRLGVSQVEAEVNNFFF